MNISNNWEKIHSDREWGKYPNEELIRFIGKYFFKIEFEKRNKIKILELGVGQGANVWFLVREGFDVYGVDISNSAIEKMKNRLKKENMYTDKYSLCGGNKSRAKSLSEGIKELK